VKITEMIYQELEDFIREEKEKSVAIVRGNKEDVFS
jgi:hypothetical protein